MSDSTTSDPPLSPAVIRYWWVWFAAAILLALLLGVRGQQSAERREAAIQAKPETRTSESIPQADEKRQAQIEAAAIKSLETSLLSALQTLYRQDKQKLFYNVHPVGTAKDVVIHDVEVTGWKRGRQTRVWDDVREVNIRYTIYWEGPVIKDGFTKIQATFDAESQRWSSSKIDSTNGITNSELGDAAVMVAGQLILQALANGN